MALGNPADKAEGSESPSGAMAGPKTQGENLANIHFSRVFLVKSLTESMLAPRRSHQTSRLSQDKCCERDRPSLQSGGAGNGSISAIELGLWSSEAHSARR